MDVHSMMEKTDDIQGLVRYLVDHPNVPNVAKSTAIEEYMVYTDAEIQDIIKQFGKFAKETSPGGPGVAVIGSKYYDRYDSDVDRLFKELGSAAVPGIRGQDASGAGVMRLALEEGDINKDEWDAYVKDLKDSNRIKKRKIDELEPGETGPKEAISTEKPPAKEPAPRKRSQRKLPSLMREIDLTQPPPILPLTTRQREWNTTRRGIGLLLIEG
jgi:polyhydroxyalkanoate synthesis regulator phasin